MTTRAKDPVRPRFPEGRPDRPAIYVIFTQSLCPHGAALDRLRALLAAGVDVVQVREKGMARADLLSWSRIVRAETAAANACLVINDDPETAAEVSADGVHVGQDDMPPDAVRRIVGPKMWIGLSTHSTAEALAAAAADVDVIGLGPCFPTRTKDAGAPLRTETLRAVRAMNLGIPVYPIGGIDQERAKSLAALGFHGVAVSSFLLAAPDPAAATRAMRNALLRPGV